MPLDTGYILVLRKVLFDVADEIITNGEYRCGEKTTDGRQELKAIDAFFTEYPTLGQLEREGKL